MQSAQVVLTHQPFDSVLATSLPGFSQIQKYTRRSVDAVTGYKGRADQAQQPRVFLGSIRNWMLKPFVEAARRNLENSTHSIDRVLAPMGFNELVGSSYPSGTHSSGHFLLPGFWKHVFSCLH